MSTTTQISAGKRIAALLDDCSFVEIGGFVTAKNTDFNLQNKEVPGDGIITGYGTIEGNLVYVYSQDTGALAGSIGEMHARKIVKLYELAMKMGAPVIGMIDCAGLRLEEATDALDGLGQIYYNQVMASGVIPQITAVFGTCGGGMALVPALTDFAFMEEKKAKLFVNSPNALDGNYTAKCDTAAAKFQSEEAGTVDFVGEEAEVLAQMRELITLLPANNEDDMSYEECEDDLNRICDGIEGFAGDTRLLLTEISDDNFFFETKRDYAKEMVTGLIRLNGMTVGAVANCTEVLDEEGKVKETFKPVLTTAGARKAARFVKFCDAFSIPILTLTNVIGFEATKCQERDMARTAAALTAAFVEATVPKVNIIIGDAFGSAYVAMNAKSLGADVVYAWPDVSIGTMEPEAAVKIMYAEEIKASKDAPALIREKASAYSALQSNVKSAAQRGYVDDIIPAADTRKRAIAAFEMLFTKREDRPSKKHGTI